MELEQVGRIVSEREQEKLEFHQTVEKIENKELLERCLKSEEWAVWRKVWKQIHDRAQAQLSQIDPKDTVGIMKLQMSIDFYANVLPRSIDNYRQLGREAFGIAKEQGWMDRVLSVFQKR